VLKYVVEENDYWVDWKDKYPSEEIITTYNRKEALKAFSESAWRKLHVKEGNESFSIMCNLKGIVWGYPDNMFYVPIDAFEYLSERQKSLFNEIVNELKVMNNI